MAGAGWGGAILWAGLIGGGASGKGLGGGWLWVSGSRHTGGSRVYPLHTPATGRAQEGRGSVGPWLPRRWTPRSS